MKRLAVYISISLMMGRVIGQGIIIDHTCVDVAQIPQSYIELAKQNTHIQWCGQSHSSQGLCGLDRVEAIYPTLQSNYVPDSDPDAPSWPTLSNSYLEVFHGNVGFENTACCTSITPQGYWQGSGADWTADMMSWYPFTNVSIFVWCWQLQSNTSTYVQQYLNQMELFEQTYPGCTFVYTTNNAQAGGQEGVTRAANNEIIRQYCITNNKVLYDFADLDSWYNGEHYTETYNGVTFEKIHPSYLPEECGHINQMGYEQKGRALWWLAARLNGWNHSLTNEPEAFNNTSTFILFPNPANNVINIEFDSFDQGSCILTIMDLRGVLIIREECEKIEGKVKKSIEINHLAKGSYIVSIKSSTQALFSRFTKS